MKLILMKQTLDYISSEINQGNQQAIDRLVELQRHPIVADKESHFILGEKVDGL